MSFHTMRRWLISLLAVFIITAMGTSPAFGLDDGGPDASESSFVTATVALDEESQSEDKPIFDLRAVWADCWKPPPGCLFPTRPAPPRPPIA